MYTPADPEEPDITGLQKQPITNSSWATCTCIATKGLQLKQYRDRKYNEIEWSPVWLEGKEYNPMLARSLAKMKLGIR
jgi:hypothetical protein